jgi:hypothetical protein
MPTTWLTTEIEKREGGATPVDIKRVRKLLKAGEMEESRCAKEFVTA